MKYKVLSVSELVAMVFRYRHRELIKKLHTYYYLLDNSVTNEQKGKARYLIEKCKGEMDNLYKFAKKMSVPIGVGNGRYTKICI